MAKERWFLIYIEYNEPSVLKESENRIEKIKLDAKNRKAAAREGKEKWRARLSRGRSRGLLGFYPHSPRIVLEITLGPQGTKRSSRQKSASKSELMNLPIATTVK